MVRSDHSERSISENLKQLHAKIILAQGSSKFIFKVFQIMSFLFVLFCLEWPICINLKKLHLQIILILRYWHFSTAGLVKKKEKKKQIHM